MTRNIIFAIIALLLYTTGFGKMLSIIAVGDMMPGTNYPDDSYLPDNDGENLISTELKKILRSGYITCGNLEGCILDNGERSERKNSKYLFRIPENLSSIFIDNGFDLLSIANNHAGDFGDAGRLNTMQILDSLNIGYAGQLECPTCIIERQGNKIGFIALAPNRNCLSHWDMQEVKRLITELKKSCDLVVASIHYGGEGEEFLHLKNEVEYYYGENRGNPVEIGHQIVDAGADLVIGSGPHLPRAMECYQGKLIAYSLGNFLTWRRFNLSGDYRPLAPILRVNYDDKGNFHSGEIISAIQNCSDGVHLDKQKRAFKLIKKLTEEDLPDSGLRFKEGDQSSSFYPLKY